MLSPVLIWPPNSGAKIRMFHIIKYLSHRFDITLLSLAENLDARELGPLTEWCRDVKIMPEVLKRHMAALRSALSLRPYRVVKFWSPRFQQRCDAAFDQVQLDVVWVNFLNMMVYVHPPLASSSLVVLDQHNADERIWMQYAEQGTVLRRLFGWWNLLKVRRFQERMLEHVDVLISVSEEETEFMRHRVCPSTTVWTIPNGIDTKYFRPKPLASKPGNVILFCGSMDVTMNVDAVRYFAYEVFPIVKRDVPDAEFWIVGRNPGKDVHKLAALHAVRVVGTVEDVRPFYEKAKVSVTPFRFGAGTKLKILESMAMGVPVVSTSNGCQGIEARAAEEIWVADDAKAFADAVIQLLLDEQQNLKISAAARKLVEERYDWEVVLENVGDKLIQAVFRKRGYLSA
jgi:sugar transferase (PEP-CTERM/EpsH1 system associated)